MAENHRVKLYGNKFTDAAEVLQNLYSRHQKQVFQ